MDIVNMFKSMSMAPVDPVLGLSEIYRNDKHKKKINLGIGVYTDKINDAPILMSVKHAEALLLKKETSKNYLSIEGMQSFNLATQLLLFGHTNSTVHKDRIRTIQTIGGTGALRIAAECIAKNSNSRRTIWISDPSWINHYNIFLAAGLEINVYPYYDDTTHTINFDKLFSTLNKIKSGDIVLFHACCHNPTGLDPNPDQWNLLSECATKNNWIPLFDLAYQGFDHSLQSDLRGIHTFCKNNPELIICNSYSKNFGLYNERVGACTIVAENNTHAEQAFSQLRSVVRASYSNPPFHGAAIISTILLDSKLRSMWEDELNNIRKHIKNIRNIFFYTLQNINKSVSKNFDFIKNQKGMFSYIGLNAKQVLKLRKNFGIYLVGSGRINLAGLSDDNVIYVCKAIQSLFT